MDSESGSAPGPIAMPHPFDLGRAMRGHRKARGMTQAHLADVAGVSAKWISEVENGKPTAEIGRIMTVLAHLGIALSVIPRPESALDLAAHIDSFGQRH